MADADLIQVIRQDHAEITSLLAAVGDNPSVENFGRLARKIEVHETTEQEIVHPLAASVDGGEPVAHMRLAEESAGTKALEQLEAMGVDDPGFAAAFAAFRGAVLSHAEHEEGEEHPKLVAALDHERLVDLGEKFRIGEQSLLDASA
jgi:hypothetical protein